ncbi:alpha/beta fold hydrolase [Kineococcus sp. NUM-3379]
MTRNPTRSRALLAAALAFTALPAVPAAGAPGEHRPARGVVLLDAHADSPSGARCRAYSFPVAVLGARHRVYGELCTRGRRTSRTPVQVLLHGGTYDHAYWDWPHRPRTHSYVDHATRAGYATLNLDRLGYGRSDRPDGRRLDFAVGAAAVHQVVEHLRAGALGPRAGTVVLNGHSMGGLVAERAAALGGVDAVVVSGIPARRGAGGAGPDGDGPGGDGPADPLFPFHPAQQDPKFAAEPWAAHYLTTRPGTRAGVFLAEGTHDPAVVPLEEAAKDTLAVAELLAVRPGPGTGPGAEPGPVPPPRAEVPTAYAVGEHDTLACGGTACTGGADLVVRRAGHSVNVSHGAPEFYRWTSTWLRSAGAGPAARPQPCAGG